MSTQIVVNGEKITNSAANAVIVIFALLVVGGITALLLFLILPMIGVILSLSIGLVIVALIVLGVGIPLILASELLVRVVMTPFVILKERLTRKSGY